MGGSAPQKICFKHNENKVKVHFSPPNLEIW